MELSTEILAAIVALLTDEWDIEAIPLVNKALAAVAAPHLFESIHISPLARDVDDAQLIYEHFGEYIRTVTISGATRSFSPFDSHSPMFERHDAWMRSEIFHDGLQPFSNLHLRHLAGFHTVICEERKIALTPSGLERFLRRVLKHDPRIEKVRFSMFSRWGENTSIGKLEKSCVEPRCLEAQKKLYNYSKTYFPEPGIWDIRAQINGTIQTISKAGVALKELEFCGYRQSLSIPKGIRGTFGTLPNLSKLFLNIDVDCDGKHKVSTWLAASTQLEKLIVRGTSRIPYNNNHSNTTIDEVFATCRFPKLKILSLQYFDSDFQELVSFIQRCGQLEQFVLLAHDLRDNTIES